MRAYAIIGLQYGSEGKGLLAGYLAKLRQPDAVVCAFGPNAGHTFTDREGHKFVSMALPSGSISPTVKAIFLGPGTSLHADNLRNELKELAEIRKEQGLQLPEVFIHEHAAVVTQRHRDESAARSFKVGGTMKGAGKAAIQKMLRDPDDQNVAKVMLRDTDLEARVVDRVSYLNLLTRSKLLQIEGAQGFGLSLHHGFYPYCCARDTSIHQVLADCGLPFDGVRTNRVLWRDSLEVIGVCRTYPIRVANRFDSEGKQIGWSGPCYHDQREVTWEEVGVEPEFTTVTKLKRRVFTFSSEQIKHAIIMNGVSSVFLNFVNYVGRNYQLELMKSAITEAGANVTWEGLGPREDQIEEVGYAARFRNGGNTQREGAPEQDPRHSE